MTGRPSNAWIWIAASAAISVGVAAVEIAIARDLDHGLPFASAAVARFAFLPFWLSYTGGAWVALGFARFAAVRDHARELGLAFAAAVAIHLGLIGWQLLRGYSIAPAIVAIFGAAALLTLLLCVFSLPSVASRIPHPALATFRLLATTYIALAYLQDFAVRPQPAVLHYWVAYAPYAALDLMGLAARALAALRGLWNPWRNHAPAH